MVKADFPHKLEIHVVEHRPAAMVGGLAVAGDGTILRGLPVEGSLPKIDVRDDLQGDRLTSPAALHGARVAGLAPAALRPRLERIDMRSQDGIVVELRDGPELIFGDATRVRAKWVAATRVLADPDSAGRDLHRRPATGAPGGRRPPGHDARTGRAGRIRAADDAPGNHPSQHRHGRPGDRAARRPRRRPSPSRRPPRARRKPRRRAQNPRLRPPTPRAPGAPRRLPAKSQPLLEVHPNPRPCCETSPA